MKYEFIEFYQKKGTSKYKNFLGTVHIYMIDIELDIRGIMVFKQGKGIYFKFPHFKAFDDEEQKNVIYPMLRFTNEATHKEMMNFMHQKVKPEILRRLCDVDKRKAV